MQHLPVFSVVRDVRSALRQTTNLVLEAPPGAGKTTGVPLALLDEQWLDGKRLVMLEPRRLATRAAAYRLADLRGEAVGQTVGYRMRMDQCISSATRIEVVTEGILTCMLHDDPGLESVGVIIFDEYHERSLNADLGLALSLDLQAMLRPDLRLVVMSATLAAEDVQSLLGEVPVIHVEGQVFPVKTRYAQRPIDAGNMEAAIARTVRQALHEEEGSVLVFLPGGRDIRRVHRLLKEARLPSSVRMIPLHGDLPQKVQQEAIMPAPRGVRKVVLATDIAESSLTIEGIRVVVDSGYRRVPRFDPRTGLTPLDTVRISRASADQRRGRAGRTESGICHRLWTEAEHAARSAYGAPEILNADLAPLVLDLADWAVADPASLRWLDPPPKAASAQARELLVSLGALRRDGRITRHGRAILKFGMHPRLAHMVLKAGPHGWSDIACELAALLGERDILHPVQSPGDPDVALRLEVLHNSEERAVAAGMRVDRSACRRVRQLADRWRKHLGGSPTPHDYSTVGKALAFAYPDRIAKRRSGSSGRFVLCNGRGASLPVASSLAKADYVVVADVDDSGRDARIWLAAALEAEDLFSLFADRITQTSYVEWDSANASVAARREWRLGSLLLRSAPLENPSSEDVSSAIITGIREHGLECLPWTRGLLNWRARVLFLRNIFGDSWPDVTPEHLERTLEDWLGPFLAGYRKRDDLSRVDLKPRLMALLDWRQQEQLEELAPERIKVASGSWIHLDYIENEIPVLPVRVQEMFGAREAPRIAGGKMPVLLHLLSPAGRPVQVTQDLENFWNTTYARVRRDLRGRYPRHHWPEDPWHATPTRHAKPRNR
ncbi:MAG: ATP-dependent helicase HrpB [Candidatus Pacebacteria bacterium]|nr:ATP-dependent helicase HrpB [Candidatus Paceibacterota bacterium]